MLPNPTTSPPADLLHRQFPYRLLPTDPQVCEWLENSAKSFTEPFFDETISRLRAAPSNQRGVRGAAHLDLLPAWAARLGPDRQPTAIIFHVSRCGSTLFSQLLALQPQHMVLSEVPFFDALLRRPFQNPAVSSAAAADLFHAALQLYVGSAPQAPEHVFIKADSWHLHFFAQLRALYPAVPFILLYRDPWEVLQSQQRHRGLQSVPSLIEPAVFGFSPGQATTDLDQYMSQVLHSYFTRLLAVADDAHCVLVNYSEGAVAGMRKIVAATGIPFSPEYERVVEKRAGFHAKHPGQVFREENDAAAPPAFLAPVTALYHQLEALRNRPA